MEELLWAPGVGPRPRVRVDRRYEHDDLAVEELSWQRAVFLKPAGARGRLPAVLALLDHGGSISVSARSCAFPGAAIP
jgi:hypothetical protein